MLLTASVMLATQMARKLPPRSLVNGMVLTSSCAVAAKDYRFSTSEGSQRAGEEQIPTLKPAVTIRGNNITVDFNFAILRGAPPTAEPDQRKGLAILVEGANITIKNLKVRGYKVGLLAKGCRGLRILNSDFSYNWKQRLYSTPERENEADWQSYHHNDHNEWLRYGAGMYLEGCSAFEVKDVRVNGGQCGLMLVRSNQGVIWNNDFSFNSGVGLGLYRSSSNKVAYNKIDWCVRGFSYGVYNRGQDSAGILIFELCDKNLFAFNSVTHGGDGFFLWAGQTMMDTGKGGCNGNILFGNDFSHSPCNAIEATFSSNTFANNKLVECWHGVWGGFSFNTNIVANVFAHNGEAIAIEHGQDNRILGNMFERENTAIDLWLSQINDPNWSYPKHHDVASRDFQISGNSFIRSTGPAISIRDTQRVQVDGNEFQECASALKQAGDNTGSKFNLGDVQPGPPGKPTMMPSGKPIPDSAGDTASYLRRFEIPWFPTVRKQRLPIGSAEQRFIDSSHFIVNNTWWRNAVSPGSSGLAHGRLSAFGDVDGKLPFLKPGDLRGQKYIFVDQWGPYDFKSPRIVARGQKGQGSAAVTERFELLGPKGRWRLLSAKGIRGLSASTGKVPGFVDLYLKQVRQTGVEINLEYIGSSTTDYRGIVTPAGKPLMFGYSDNFIPIDWDIKFFKWDASTDPRTQDQAFKKLIAGTPIKEVHTTKLDYAGGTFEKEVGPDHFATICEGSFSVPAGRLTLELTTDDGARAWVDGKPVITNAWKYQGPTVYTADLTLDASVHHIRVEHFQIDGYAALRAVLSIKH